jgi:hypothetical protein
VQETDTSVMVDARAICKNPLDKLTVKLRFMCPSAESVLINLLAAQS